MSSLLEWLPAPNSVAGFLLFSLFSYALILLAEQISIPKYFDVEEYRKRRVLERTQREQASASRKKDE